LCFVLLYLLCCVLFEFVVFCYVLQSVMLSFAVLLSSVLFCFPSFCSIYVVFCLCLLSLTAFCCVFML